MLGVLVLIPPGTGTMSDGHRASAGSAIGIVILKFALLAFSMLLAALIACVASDLFASLAGASTTFPARMGGRQHPRPSLWSSAQPCSYWQSSLQAGLAGATSIGNSKPAIVIQQN
jgi:hypothetical protein